MDKNAEVIVCGSFMKDVWECRLREYRQKRQLEDERIQKSALERINQDWQARMSSMRKTPKRLERKAKLPEESTLDAPKTKKTYLGRPQGFQSSRIQRQVDLTKTTKSNKLALLHHLNESCPGLMVWSKSWKFSQPLPQPVESPCAFDWGQSWKFLNLQPNTDGKPWFDLGFDTNNNMSFNDMLLWEKLSKALNSEHIQQDLASTEWEKSWIFTRKGKESHEGTNKSDSNKFYNLWGEQNQESASEWHESWKTMKPVKGENIMPDSIPPSTNEETQSKLPWDNSWMYFKKQLHMKSKTGNNLGWRESWKVAKTISEQKTKSIETQGMVPKELHPDICNVIMNVSREMKHTFQFGGTDAPLSDWEKSWTTIKNLSEYKEEINKAECREVEVKVETPKPDQFKQQSERVKFNVLALPKIQKRQEMLQFSKQMDWKDSWKMLKRQRREESALRNLRYPLPQLSSTPQTLTEWANSWRFTNLTLNQDSSLWQQGWSTNTQPRPVRRVLENENFPHNGPAGVRVWSESWRSTRRQHLLERQGQGASTQPVRQHTYARSVADWERSWESSTHQRSHDRPSVTEWADSWRFSSLENFQPEHTWFEKSMEIKGRKELRNAFSRSDDSQIFKEQLPSKEWNDSWRVKKRSDGRAHLIQKEVLDWDNSWMFTSTEFYRRQGECYLNFQLTSDVSSLKSIQTESRSEWGRSWKMSNPQPPKNIASWVDAKPKTFSAQDMILWSKHKHIYYLPCALVKDLKLKIWSNSWRFMMMESKHGKSSASAEDESVIMTKTATIRKHLYSNIDQQKPQQKRWSDACKIAKTQPRPKRNVKSGNKEDENGKEMFAEWMESWKFSNNLKSNEPAMVSVSLSNWKNSWKFLLDPYVPMNGPKTNKSR
ncbi:uncharacterized protein LOC125262461 [Megalobrama amblycephala]|uniref:uncharacterized protein LOC125262461 n=1 Tax=Megalobrama amblycephala TaxID=75352 RepID=UPI002013C3FF|nr:uncharacterized protein LOC125262461 [Megalobrama amblycephala]